MVKQRMGTADVAGEVACLRQKVLGMRVANVYDINPKTYMLKLARSGDEGEKVFLVLEAGTRFHTTQYVKEKSDSPSNFTLKLRKHLRARRLEDVRQLGVDRLVDFTLGSGEGQHHLLLELYSQGNVILTDAKYEVLTLLRSHRDDAKGFAIMARHPYPIHTVRLRAPLDPAQLAAALDAADDKATLRSVLAGVLPYGPALAEHCLVLAGLAPGRRPAAEALGEGERGALLAGVRQWEAWLDACETRAPEGFISLQQPGGKGAKANGAAAPQTEPSAGGAGGGPAHGGEAVAYEDYDPLVMAQHSARRHLRFDTFDAALDEFYAKIEGQRAAAAAEAAQRAAAQRLERIRTDQTARAAELQTEARQAEMQAELIEYNLDAVDAAINAVREALASGLDWRQLARMIKDERKAGNPVAGLIDSLQLERNRITLLLSNFLDTEEEGDEEAQTRPATRVEVDLGCNAAANARLHYEARRRHTAKEVKTLDANQRALKVAHKKSVAQLSKVKPSTAAQQLRKPHWFEKFNWFISSENYLVISGRDAQQNELVVKRYLKSGDVYVHADLHGAASTIIKNHNPDAPIPPLTVSQAGAACVCRSAAWDAKIVTSAWWVYHHQVSKTAPSGEYLTTGSFMVRGKKNYLPPSPLIMGFTYLFKLDESSLAGHVGERAPRLVDADGESVLDGPDGLAAAAERQLSLDQLGNDEADDAASVSEAADSQPDSPRSAGADANDGPAASAAEPAGDGDQGGAGSSNGTRQVGGVSASALEAFLDSAADPLARGAAVAYQRYGLAGPDDDTTEAHGEPAEASTSGQGGADSGAGGAGQPGRRHLSAKERQQLRKQRQRLAAGQEGDGGGEGEPQATPAEAQQASASGTASGSGPGRPAGAAAEDGAAAAAAGATARPERSVDKPEKATQQQAAAARGRKGKAGKARDKYADQDEEDRALAMALLASAGAAKGVKDKKEARKAKREARRGGAANGAADALTPAPDAELLARVGAKQAPAPGRGRPPAGGSRGGTTGAAGRAPADQASKSPAVAAPDTRQAAGDQAAAATSSSSQAAAAPAGGGEGAEAVESDADDDIVAAATAGASAEEAAEVAALLAAEQVEVLAEEDRDRLTLLDSLTGAPRAEDILQYALPCCAPYSALTSYKYRLKLTPGTQRKGKAARQAVELLSRLPEASARERELMRASPEMEAITCLVGTVKISMPGLSKLKTGAKKGRKAAARSSQAGEA